MMGKMTKLIFLGPPGAGKGTQADIVSDALGVVHISTGDALRAAVKEGTPIGLKAKSFMESGGLVPDDVIMGIVSDLLKKPDMVNGFLFDGFPRTLYQAEALDAMTAIDIVINIEMPDEMIIERMTGRRVCSGCGHTTHIEFVTEDNKCPHCGAGLTIRDDDAPDIVRSRLQVYHSLTAPLIDYYMSKGLLQTVDGSVGKVNLSKRIMSVLTGV